MNEIIYLPMRFDPTQVTPAELQELMEDAHTAIGSASQGLQVKNKKGGSVKIFVEFDSDYSEPDDFFNASAGKLNDERYSIRIGAGLLWYLNNLSKALVVNKKTLRGVSNGTVLSRIEEGHDAQLIMGSFLFHFSVGLIFWHEFSHIVMGHLDWLNDETALAAISELHMRQLGEKEERDLRTLEGEADRQAANFWLSLVDLALTSNPYLKYHNDSDKFYDAGYLIGAIFKVFDAIELELPHAKRTHPSNDVRTMMSIHFLDKYFGQYRKADAEELKAACMDGANAAIQNTVHRAVVLRDPNVVLLETVNLTIQIGALEVHERRLKANSGDSSFIIKRPASF